jgi:hypothetical protein
VVVLVALAELLVLVVVVVAGVVVDMATVELEAIPEQAELLV